MNCCEPCCQLIFCCHAAVWITLSLFIGDTYRNSGGLGHNSTSVMFLPLQSLSVFAKKASITLAIFVHIINCIHAKFVCSIFSSSVC